MSNDRCPICGEYDVMARVLGRPHRCPPTWYCRTEDYAVDDAERVYAIDAEEAACQFAQRFLEDSGYADEGAWTVLVQGSHPDGPWEQFEVRSELIVEYRAEAV